MEAGEERDPESDEDYFDDTYANRRKRRGGATPTGPGSRGGRTRKSQPEDTPAKRGRAVSHSLLLHFVGKQEYINPLGRRKMNRLFSHCLVSII